MSYDMDMKKSRDQSIDILRGWAIVLMIVSHTIFFRYGLGSGLLNTVLNFANTFCYITFLFTFGVGIYHSMIATQWDVARRVKIEKRILLLLLLYYVVGTISLWSYYPLTDWNIHLLVSETWRIITFRYYASFTEYIPTFALFMIIFYTLRSRVGDTIRTWFSDKKISIVLFVTLLLHFGVNWLSHFLVVVPLYLRPLIGSTRTFDFPILHYLIVVVMGIWSASWGDKKDDTTRSKTIMIGYTLLVVSLMIKGSFNYNNILGWIPAWINTPLRWPPSLSFIVSGLASTYLFWIVSQLMTRIPLFDLLAKFLVYMGRRGMGFLLYHLLLLFIAKIMQVPLFDIVELVIFCLLIPLSYITAEKGLALIRNSRYNTANEKAA
jgi:hypothetical protein